MSQETMQTLPENKPASKKGAITAGVLLIGIGLGLLIFRFTALDEYFPLFLGLVFLVSGMLTRSSGLLIPGGIIGGVGLGVVAIDNAWFGAAGEPASGGLFLLAFSLGWFLIPVLTRVFAGKAELWALIPGGILAVIGALILGGEQGLAILNVLGEWWPLALVIVGAWTLIGYFRKSA